MQFPRRKRQIRCQIDKTGLELLISRSGEFWNRIGTEKRFRFRFGTEKPDYICSSQTNKRSQFKDRKLAFRTIYVCAFVLDDPRCGLATQGGHPGH